MGGTRRIGSIALLALLLTLVGSALAATGDLTPQGCIQDSDAVPDNCTQITAGLNEAQAIVVSPDGTSVYATSLFDDAVIRFDRDPATGALTPQGCIEDNDTGDDKCATEVNGLSEVRGLAVSPDGASLYVVSQSDDAITHFARNSSTGQLTFVECIEDEDGGGDDCDVTPGANGLNDPFAVAVSPDGTSVYTAANADDAVSRFDRNTSTGVLTPQECVDDDDTGAGDDCARDTDGLDQANSVAVSPDGSSVYAGSEGDDAVVRLTTTTTGRVLGPQACVDDNDTGNDDCAQSTDGLDRPLSLTVSPDNLSLYVASADDADAMVRFDRAGDGALTPQGCIEDNDSGLDDCGQSTDGLDDPFWVTASGDGLSVYAAARGDDAVVVFDRSLNPGALTPKGCVDDNDPPQGGDDCAQTTDGLNGADSVAVSPDGSSLYTLSQFDQAVVAFGREVPATTTADTDPPETTITKKPKKRTKKRKAKFEFTSDEPGSTFQCKLDKKEFAPCAPPFKKKVKRRKHRFQVRAIDPAGNVDPTPAQRKWKVKKKRTK